jgi:predicted RNase H-like HicB family nuclease
MDFLSIQNRARFLDIWKKASKDESLEGEEALFGKIMLEHSEFHSLFNLGEAAFEIDFAGQREINPFLHTSLHAVVEQQLASHNPQEVEQAVQATLARGETLHEAIHRISGILAEVLFEAVQKNRPIDESLYIKKVQGLIA